ncbi:MAG: MFS transporter [Gammaproteobacteria bacterium]|nr:MFS transporter [Gammaproteobacteria bacterium]
MNITPKASIAPLKIKIFRNIWIANLISNLGTWMHNIGAGWLMTDLSSDPFLVSMIQVSVVLPGFILTIPAGVLADIIDRRIYLLISISWMIFFAVIVGLVTIAGNITPFLLISFTFALGMGTAMILPAFTALTPDLVPKSQLVEAVTLNSIAMNITRALGPAVAGILIAISGPGLVFILNGLSFIGIFFVILNYNNSRIPNSGSNEKFFEAMSSGFNFLLNSEKLLTVMLRTITFFSVGSAILTFLPLIVREEMGAGPQTYSILVTSMGIGAVIAGLTLTNFRARYKNNNILIFSIIITSLSLLGLAYIRSIYPLIIIMFFSGISWMCAVSTLHVSAQLSLPAWVRARGMSLYLSSFMGSWALGSAIWGQIAKLTNISIALTVAVIFGLIINLITAKRKLVDI